MSDGVAAVQSSTSDFTFSAGWNATPCRYVDGSYSADSYIQPGYDRTSSTSVPTAHYVEYLPCNMQQRLVCGGGVTQYHSHGGAQVFGALQYDATQQRALSDISG